MKKNVMYSKSASIDVVVVVILTLNYLLLVLNTGCSVWALHHAPQFYVGEVFGGTSGALLQAVLSANTTWHAIVATCPHVSFLWSIELCHWIPFYELLCIHHSLHRLHHHILEPNCTRGI